jgi:hypothetical protein
MAERPAKKARGGAGGDVPCCAICLLDAPPPAAPAGTSGGAEWALREEHGCGTCTKGAWSV